MRATLVSHCGDQKIINFKFKHPQQSNIQLQPLLSQIIYDLYDQSATTYKTMASTLMRPRATCSWKQIKLNIKLWIFEKIKRKTTCHMNNKKNRIDWMFKLKPKPHQVDEANELAYNFRQRIISMIHSFDRLLIRSPVFSISAPKINRYTFSVDLSWTDYFVSVTFGESRTFDVVTLYCHANHTGAIYDQMKIRK